MTADGGGFYGAPQAAIHDQRYGDLARAYAALLIRELAERGLGGGLVVDLGCGSGILAQAMTAAGHDVLGVDLSPAMLAIARGRAPAARFQQGSVWDADLPDAVAITATGEVLGYLADDRAGDPGRLPDFLRRAADALRPGGLLAFDLAAPGRGGPTGTREQFVDAEDWVMHFRATEDAAARRLRRDMVIFWRDGEHYRRVREAHHLRLDEPERVEALVRDAGLRLLPDPGLPGPAEGWFAVLAQKPG